MLTGIIAMPIEPKGPFFPFVTKVELRPRMPDNAGKDVFAPDTERLKNGTSSHLGAGKDV